MAPRMTATAIIAKTRRIACGLQCRLCGGGHLVQAEEYPAKWAVAGTSVQYITLSQLILISFRRSNKLFGSLSYTSCFTR